MLGHDGNAGMIPLAIDRMFDYAEAAKERQWAYTFKVSLIEIYCEDIKDLLASVNKSSLSSTIIPVSSSASSNSVSSAMPSTPSKDHGLRLSHDKSGKVQLTGLESFQVGSASDVHALLDVGTKQRSVGATACNTRSSRSHTVFQLTIEGANSKTNERIQSTVNLIDLAGSGQKAQHKRSQSRSTDPLACRNLSFIA